MIEVSPTILATLGGFAGGTVLGFAARWGRFCTFAAIEDSILGADSARLRMWGLAIATAIAGVYTLDLLGVVNVAESIYLASPASIFSTIVGGLLFGLGMSLVGTCGFGILSRIGGGDLKSTVSFLVMGISAYATINGIMAYPRIWFFPQPVRPEQPAGIAHQIANIFNVAPGVVGLVLAAVLAAFVLSNGALLRHRRFLITGILVGATVVFGWWVVSVGTADPFNPQPPGSFTFAAPLGDTILFIMAATGSELDFGIGSVVGVVGGAWLTTLLLRDFRWEACDDAIELRRQMFGGMFMGIGGILALGCTIGQGLSAASALAISAPVALASMYIGAWFGLQFLVSGSLSLAIHSVFSKKDRSKS